ncbi:phospholipid hydroperoxide glutathione peroxidase-like proteinue [Fowlpox virus]|nr:phospholipid hydroperoxide glutathione peroxidase-like proteinue [Fowlpox virus]URH25040.1 phospholipid hydroperoxide glutathione peroxidase-like proteinue [Fowlpox virus]URH25304.1 phospholipid hydroperoxide glutathione peroxidase-like proteinue [Fowlpox virus]URH25565.1 phospholipid hydroperoxide glutathione peroxidase-like proteinue [Fowlpox virus]URH25823.1 phospholipid hydroperoxide glutathione peroxidase-like proteinue [Fowlpox virus]
MNDDWILHHTIYNFNLNLLNGESFDFKTYKDKICIFVNVASE